MPPYAILATGGQPDRAYGILLKMKSFFLVTLVVLITAVSFLPSLDNEFTNWDDQDYVTHNPQVRDLSWGSVAYFFSDIKSSDLNLYKPLVTLSYAVEYHFFGLNPRAYHTTNLVLHLINVILVFYLFAVLGESALVCFVVAALFGIHPMHVESVAWVTERKDVLYSVFFLASLIAYVSYIKNSRKNFYALSLLFFLLSILSKPMALTLPVVLLLLDALAKRSFNPRIFIEKIPFFILALGLGLLTLVTAPKGLYSEQLFRPTQWLTMSDTLIFYVTKLAAPFNISNCYAYPIQPGYLWGGFLFSPLLLLAGGVALFWFARRSPKILFGVLFFLVTILPTVQTLPSAFLAADRYTYIPALGPFYLFALGLCRFRRLLAVLMLAVLLSVFSVITWQRCGVWKNSLTLWNDVLKKHSPAPSRNNGVVLAYNNRGAYFISLNKSEEALADLNRAVELAPEYSGARNNRGLVYSQMGDHRKAVEDFTRVIRFEPDFPDVYVNRGFEYRLLGDHSKALADFDQALRLKPANASAYNNRGIIASEMGWHGRALEDYARALKINPYSAETLNNRGNEYSIQGRQDEAIADFTRALTLAPQMKDAYNNRGYAYAQKGENLKALADFRRALRIDPDLEMAKNNLAKTLLYQKEILNWSQALQAQDISVPERAKIYYNRATLYANQGASQKAVLDFSRAITLNPDLAEAYNNRGTLYQERGRDEEALKDYQKAVDLNPKFTEASFNRERLLKKKKL